MNTDIKADTDNVDAIQELMMPAAETVAAMLRGVDSARLDRPTPCQDWDLHELVHHVLGTTTGLAKIGRKEDLGTNPWAGPEVTDDWNIVLADRFEVLAAAWSEDDAWAGSVQLGSEMPASAIGDMAYAEILLHGWDLARALGAELSATPEMAAALRRTVAETAELGREMDAYGPEVAVADDASDLDHALAAAGRDPNWAPAT